MDFYATSKSLKQIKEAGFEDDFELVIFDDIIRCSKFIASFISPTISKIIRNDPTAKRYYILFPDKSSLYSTTNELKQMIQDSNFIHHLENFFEGQSIHIDKMTTSKIMFKSGSIINNDNSKDTDISKLLIIFGKILNNEEMINGGLKFLGIEEDNIEVTSNNVFDLIEFSRIRDDNSKSQQLFEFLASNFFKLFNKENVSNLQRLKRLSVYELENVFKSPKMQVQDEDSLFNLILSLGNDYYSLLDYVEIQYLSIKNIEKLIQLININDISLHPLLWSSICRRLISDPSKIPTVNNPRQKNTISICVNGIIRYLNDISKENVYSSKEIDVESSKIDVGKCESLFDFNKDTHFRLANQKGSFIIFDFKNKKIKFSKYYLAVPSQKSTAYTGRPKSWRIECSNDKVKWDLVDIKQNDSSLMSWSSSNTFTCQFNSNQFYRYVRIKDIVSQNGTQEFLLSEIDFYGSIK